MTRPRRPPPPPAGFDLWWPRVIGAVRDVASVGIGIWLLVFKHNPSLVTQMIAVALLGGTASYAAARFLDRVAGGGSGNGRKGG